MAGYLGHKKDDSFLPTITTESTVTSRTLERGVKQQIISYHMTLATQAILSSVFQTRAKCCLEFAHAGLLDVSWLGSVPVRAPPLHQPFTQFAVTVTLEREGGGG